MQLISRDDIKCGERVRTPKPEDIAALANDIEEKGLFHPIVITSLEDPWLVAGETRILAIDLIAERAIDNGEDPIYRHNMTILLCDQIPYVTVGQLTARQMVEYEIAENLIRTEIPWQDKARALAKLHAMQEDSRATTTARMLVAAGDKRDVNTVSIEINRAAIVADNLDNPAVAGAKSLKEAFNVIRKDVTAMSSRVLGASAPDPTETPHTFFRDSMQNVFKDPWPASRPVDTIIADPPYGVEADSWTTKFRDTPHNYRDDLNKALADADTIFREGLRITAERANLFMFCAPQHWLRLAELAIAAGWNIWPRPVIWYKSREGIRPQGMQGFCYTYETILQATKGGKGLIRSINDVIECYKVSRHGRLHGAQKPVDIYRILIECSSLPGDTILDPTCGSGTIFPACNITKTIGIGIEQNSELWPVIEARLLEGLGESSSDLEDL
jgi:DNA modification methylase